MVHARFCFEPAVCWFFSLPAAWLPAVWLNAITTRRRVCCRPPPFRTVWLGGKKWLQLLKSVRGKCRDTGSEVDNLNLSCIRYSRRWDIIFTCLFFFNFLSIFSISIFQLFQFQYFNICIFFINFIFFLMYMEKKTLIYELSWESAIYVRNVSQQPTASYFRRRL